MLYTKSYCHFLAPKIFHFWNGGAARACTIPHTKQQLDFWFCEIKLFGKAILLYKNFYGVLIGQCNIVPGEKLINFHDGVEDDWNGKLVCFSQARLCYRPSRFRDCLTAVM